MVPLPEMLEIPAGLTLLGVPERRPVSDIADPYCAQMPRGIGNAFLNSKLVVELNRQLPFTAPMTFGGRPDQAPLSTWRYETVREAMESAEWATSWRRP